MSRSLGTVKVGFHVATRELEKGLGMASNSFSKFGSSLTRIGLGLGLAVTAPMIMIGKEAVRMAADLETAFVKIKHLTGVSDDVLKGIKSQVRGLSTELGISQQELAEGAYNITSAGIRDLATSMEILRASGRASIQGLGDIKTVSKAITAAINVYGKANLSAAEAAEVLFMTIREGEVEAASLAPTLGRVLAPAEQLGISFAEVGANLAVYTRAGVNAEEAITGLRNVMSSIASPTAEFITALDKAGTSTDELKYSIRTGGLAQGLLDLVKAIESSGQETEDLFGNIRGLVNVLAVTGQQADTYLKIVKSITESQDEMNKGAKATGDTLNWQMQRAKVAVQNLQIELGEKLAPYVSKLAGIISGLASNFQGLTDAQKETIIKVGILVAAMPFLLTALGQISQAIGMVVVPAFKTAIIVVGKFIAMSVASQAGILAIAGAAFMLWMYWDDILGVVEEYKLLTSKSYRKEKSEEAFRGTVLKMEQAYNEELAKGNKLEADRLKLWLDQIKAGDKKAIDKAKLSEYGLTDYRVPGKNLKEDFKAAWERTKNWIVEQTPLADFTNLFDMSTVDKWLAEIEKKVKGSGIPGIKKSRGGGVDTVPVISKNKLLEQLTGADERAWVRARNQYKSVLDIVRSDIEKAQKDIDSGTIFGRELDDLQKNVDLLNKYRISLEKSQLAINKMVESKYIDDELISNAVNLANETDKLAIQVKDYEISTIRAAQAVERLTAAEERRTKNMKQQDLNQRFKMFAAKYGEAGIDVSPLRSVFEGLDEYSQFWDKWGEDIQNVMGLVNELGNLISVIYDRRIAKIEETYQKDIDRINGMKMTEKQKADAIAKIEKEKEAKIAKEKRRQAIFDKALAVANAIVGTAAAVAKAGEPITAAIAAATGALSVATILATPIPKYAKGGIFYGRSVGEIGEYANVRSNPEVVSPLSDLKKLIGSSGNDVYVYGEIDGYKLKLVQQNAAQRYKRA